MYKKEKRKKKKLTEKKNREKYSILKEKEGNATKER